MTNHIQEQDNIEEWERKFGSFTCEICEGDRWLTDRKIQSIDLKRMDDSFSFKSILPVLILTCVNCGNTKFINNIVSGIMPVGYTL